MFDHPVKTGLKFLSLRHTWCSNLADYIFRPLQCLILIRFGGIHFLSIWIINRLSFFPGFQNSLFCTIINCISNFNCFRSQNTLVTEIVIFSFYFLYTGTALSICAKIILFIFICNPSFLHISIFIKIVYTLIFWNFFHSHIIFIIFIITFFTAKCIPAIFHFRHWGWRRGFCRCDLYNRYFCWFRIYCNISSHHRYTAHYTYSTYCNPLTHPFHLSFLLE